MYLEVAKYKLGANDDDLNALTLTQLTANESIIDLRTGIAFGNMYFKVEGFSYIGLPTINNITLYKDTTISGHLDVGRQVLTLKRVPGVSGTNPLAIINESLGGGTGVVYQSTASGQGFNIAYTYDCSKFSCMGRRC